MLNILVHALITPLVWFVLGALLLVISFLRSGTHGKGSKPKRAGLSLKMGAVAWLVLFYLASTPWLPGKAAGWLEAQYAVVNPQNLASRINAEHGPDTPVRVVILGAGHEQNLSLPAYMQLREAGLKRALEGTRVGSGLTAMLPQTRYLTSGANYYATRPASEIIRHALIDGGIDERIIDAQPEPANTREEARWYAERFGTDEVVVLVTSATHMRRSVTWFEHYGVEHIYPAPTDFRHFPEHSRGIHDFIPDPQHMDTLNKALVEYVGYMQALFAR